MNTVVILINIFNKKLFGSFFFCLIFLILVSESISAKQDVSRQLTEKMYAFFTETLANNYPGENVCELYENFIYHYYELSRTGSAYATNLKIDKQKLKDINKELFRRDSSNFYYFFYEVLYITESEEKKANELTENSPDIPIVIIVFEGENKSHPSNMPKFEEMHNINIPLDYGFIEDLKNEDIRTTSYIKELSAASGVLQFGLLASFFVNFGGGNELQNEATQKIISVMFWKYLCLQAGLEFNITIEELELLLRDN